MRASGLLARHLARAARAAPEEPFVLAGNRSYSRTAWLEEATFLADRIASSRRPLAMAGSALDLARHAFACSLKKRPFWPVDRSIPAAADSELPEGISLVISTSGSEGEPRGVMLADTALDAAAAAANRRLPLAAGDLWLACLPLCHIGGQSILWRCTRAGAAVLLHEGFVASAVSADLARLPVTHLSLVPAMLARLLEAGTPPPATLRHVMVGGAALAPALFERASAAGWPLNPSYGMSETAAQVATWTPRDGPWRAGLVGRPLPGCEIALRADGRIRIRSPQLMAGYVSGGGIDPDGWLTTGDLGEIDAAGRLTVTGRADDMLISGGRNVHPAEIEACLAACPGVRDAAVSALPDPVWGDLIVALVAGDTTEQQINAWCRDRLSGHALPRRVVIVDALPRGKSGKLQRAALRKLVREALR
jgi:O-succinylbenzoic acid--CoA ligase